MQIINEHNRNLVGHKSHQQTDHMQICLRAPADISNSGKIVQACFIHLLFHCYSMLGFTSARGQLRA